MKIITVPLSILFRIIVYFRNTLYKYGFLKVKVLNNIVISVGNLSVGGTGKTTFVEHIADYFLEKGKFVVIVLKGYKREQDDMKVVELGYENTKKLINTENLGDEAFLFLDNLGNKNGKGLIIVGDDKTKAAKFASSKFKPEIIIVDDGFQHRSLGRDLDIILVDGNEGSWLIPAGKLREPLKNKSRADIIIINEKFDGNKMVGNIGHIPSVICYYQLENFIDYNKVPVDLKDKKAVAFCGIGDPASFKFLLEENGINVAKFIIFKDHHNFLIKDINQVITAFKEQNADIIVTSQKDFVRLKNSEVVLTSASDNLYKQLLFNYPLYYPKIKMQIKHNGDTLYSKLDVVGKI
jgi:tetraacyldisaccharide 4'-kinase